MEYIADKKKCGAKTFFSTHYHELTELEGLVSGVKNYCISVKEQGDTIIFLRKIIRGGADKSYGIQVAALAGVPEFITGRAKEILKDLTARDLAAKENAENKSPVTSSECGKENITFPECENFNNYEYNCECNKAIEMLKDTDADSLTPLEALNLIYNLKKLI